MPAEIPYLFITAVVVPVGAIIGALGKTLWDIIKTRGENSVQARAIEVDEESQLRKDLLGERKMLLDQLIAERSNFQIEMGIMRGEMGGMKTEIAELRKNVTFLEGQNLEKAATILQQQRMLSEQELLISSLRRELDELKSHEKTEH